MLSCRDAAAVAYAFAAIRLRYYASALSLCQRAAMPSPDTRDVYCCETSWFYGTSRQRWRTMPLRC